MKYVCNPINMEYKYQLFDNQGRITASREAADPSLILFKGKYYLFVSMTAGFLTSDDLTEWEFHPLKGVPVYDYAPDVRVIGDTIYFSASKKTECCSFFWSKDPVNEGFEEIPGTFTFWDPNLFVDDDGRVYFYWGCSNTTPIYGVELSLEDMKPKGEPIALIYGKDKVHGFERRGEGHILPKTDLSAAPYVEGAWMDKHNGKYYLQYAVPGTQYNIYADGVYVSDSPLGPFVLAKNNPYSYKPGGFLPGAGHGSTLKDKYGNLWHTSTMRISVNHRFERRLGIWPAGYDKDGELFCNQRYGDWPMRIDQSAMDPWENPEWMLLSYNKPARASSWEEGKDASKVTDENVQTWWKAASNKPGEWIEIDLGHLCDVRAVQINFADDNLSTSLPDGAVQHKITGDLKTIDERKHYTRWVLEGSTDGKEYFVIDDKSDAKTDLPHDLVVREDGLNARFIRCTVKELPYGQNPCISGLRVFGMGEGELPPQAAGVTAQLLSPLDLRIEWNDVKAVGYNVLWGFAPDKLYHSYMVFGRNQVVIGALVKGQPVYIRVDTFNEKGITEGEVIEVEDINV